MQSSGDVYHALAYALLCRKMGWLLPKFVIQYDTDQTKHHATRALRLLTYFGVACSLVERVHHGGRAHHEGVRSSDARKQVFDTENARCVLLLQKSCTVLLAAYEHAYRRQHRTAPSLACVMEDQIAVKDGAIESNSTAAVKAIKGHMEAQTSTKLVVVNHRFSMTVNKEHNLQDAEVLVIVGAAKEIGAFPIVLGNLGRDELMTSFPGVHCVSMFGFGVAAHLEKVQHLDFLLKLRTAFPNGDIAMVGGTSGLLDAGIFLGIPTLCLHQFKDYSQCKSYKPCSMVPHQDYRVLFLDFLGAEVIARTTRLGGDLDKDRIQQFLKRKLLGLTLQHAFKLSQYGAAKAFQYTTAKGAHKTRKARARLSHRDDKADESRRFAFFGWANVNSRIWLSGYSELLHKHLMTKHC